MQSTSRRLIPLLLLVAMGGFLRFYQIGSKGLWLDEAFSIWMARHTTVEMLDWLVRIDQHPPLYYTLLHLCVAWGDDPTTVRALSALCSTLTIPVIYLLGRCLANERLGLLSAFILAISPFHVRFAQEARMYVLLTLTASLAMYTLAQLLTHPRSFYLTRLYWLGYVVFTTLTLLSHNTAVFFPVATNILVLILSQTRQLPFHKNPRSPFLRNWLIAQAAVFLLWLPWLPAFVRQSIGVHHEFWLPAPTWETVLGTVADFLSAYLPLSPPWRLITWGIWAGLALLGLRGLITRPRPLLLLCVTFVTPFVGEGLISLWRPIFYGRTLIWSSIPLYILLAAGIYRLRPRPLTYAILILVLVINGFSLHEYYFHFEKEQWDDAAALVAERVQPNDLVLFNATWTQIPFDYYFHRLYNRPVTEHGVPTDLFNRGVLEPKMTVSDLPRLQRLIQRHQRVWLIYSHDWYTDPQELIPTALTESLAPPLKQWEFYGLQVQLYERQ